MSATSSSRRNSARESSGPDAGAGALVLVATPIGNSGDIAQRAIEVLSKADVICCEDTRHSGQLFRRLGIPVAKLTALHAHNEAQRIDEVVERVRSGELIALVSDAGTPLVSDPGERLVARMIAEGLTITAVPGPSALLAAMTLSGMSTRRFTFEGFLPRKGPERRERLETIARASAPSVVYESPQRVRATLEDLLEHCGAEREIAVARELTKLHEEIWRGSLEDALAREDGAVLGEFVLVVAPSEPEADHDEAALRAAAGRLLAAGLGRREAVTALEVLLDVPHRSAYQIAIDATADPTVTSTKPADRYA